MVRYIAEMNNGRNAKDVADVTDSESSNRITTSDKHPPYRSDRSKNKTITR